MAATDLVHATVIGSAWRAAVVNLLFGPVDRPVDCLVPDVAGMNEVLGAESAEDPESEKHHQHDTKHETANEFSGPGHLVLDLRGREPPNPLAGHFCEQKDRQEESDRAQEGPAGGTGQHPEKDVDHDDRHEGDRQGRPDRDEPSRLIVPLFAFQGNRWEFVASLEGFDNPSADCAFVQGTYPLPEGAHGVQNVTGDGECESCRDQQEEPADHASPDHQVGGGLGGRCGQHSSVHCPDRAQDERDSESPRQRESDCESPPPPSQPSHSANGRVVDGDDPGPENQDHHRARQEREAHGHPRHLPAFKDAGKIPEHPGSEKREGHGVHYDRGHQTSSRPADDRSEYLSGALEGARSVALCESHDPFPYVLAIYRTVYAVAHPSHHLLPQGELLRAGQFDQREVHRELSDELVELICPGQVTTADVDGDVEHRE